MTLLQAATPLALGLAAWVPFVAYLRAGRRGLATCTVVVWAACLMVGLPALEAVRPGSCGRLFPGASRYAEEMLAWARTGAGCESDPACFVPQHLRHGTGFAVATVVTAGAVGLGFAAVLFGWMGAYAGALGAAAGNAVAAGLAWHPWALVRVAACVALGVGLAEPLARWGRPALPGRWRWLAAGTAGLLADVALKAALAQAWWRWVVHPVLAP